MRVASALWALMLTASLVSVVGCQSKASSTVNTGEVLVFKHGKVSGASDALGQLLREFEGQNPGVTVRSEELPSESDSQNQFYVINLESRSDAFDLLAIDVIWVQTFARADWLLPIPGLLSPSEKSDFFPAPIEAAMFNEQLVAVPWFIDAGLLYYRTDLLQKYGFSPPQTWEELSRAAQAVLKGEPGMYGFVWQGK